ncbi:MAG: helix-turn-helix transcriptional regulator, partial [bacterium]
AVPEHVYCLETHFNIGSDSILYEVWMDGKPNGKYSFYNTVENVNNLKNMMVVFGDIFGNGVKGNLYIDDVLISKEYIGVRPARPLSLKSIVENTRIKLVSSSFSSANPSHSHLFSHWQVCKMDNLLLPVYNSGAVRDRLEDIILPSYVKNTGDLYWRVRYQAGSRRWSEWSVPKILSVNNYIPERVKWKINDIEIFNVENNEKVTQLEKNKWYDFRLVLGKGGVWDSISFTDLWLEHEQASEISPISRGMIEFNPEKNYWLSLSIGTPGLWASNFQGSSRHTNVTGTNGLFWQDSLGYFKIDRDNGWVNARIKLLKNARHGLWKANAFIKMRDEYESPVFIRPILVINSHELLDRNKHSRKKVLSRRIIYISSLLLFVIILFFLIIVIKKYRKTPPVPLSRHDEMIEKIIGFIQLHYNSFDLSRVKIAQNFNISENYLGRLFKKAKNRSIVDYIMDYRIERSKELLLNTNHKIFDIAMEVGYRNVKYYITVFKRKEKITPLQFRDKYQKSN